MSELQWSTYSDDDYEDRYGDEIGFVATAAGGMIMRLKISNDHRRMGETTWRLEVSNEYEQPLQMIPDYVADATRHDSPMPFAGVLGMLGEDHVEQAMSMHRARIEELAERLAELSTFIAEDAEKVLNADRRTFNGQVQSLYHISWQVGQLGRAIDVAKDEYAIAQTVFAENASDSHEARVHLGYRRIWT